MARPMGERIADAEIHVLPGLRHSVLIEAPDTLAGLLDRFLGPDCLSDGRPRRRVGSTRMWRLLRPRTVSGVALR